MGNSVTASYIGGLVPHLVVAALGLGLAGPSLAQPGLGQAAKERIVELRVHGNQTVPSEEVLQLSGLSVGDEFARVVVEDVVTRIRASGHFDAVELRKRYRSIAATNEVVLVIIVHETEPLSNKVLFLPIVGYTEEFGFTYGGRATTINALEAGERISLPITWGGVKRVALEISRDFDAGPISTLQGGAALSRREHPHFDINDDRMEGWIGLGRSFGRFRLGAEARWTDVGFGRLDQRFMSYSIDLGYDNRRGTFFPRNSVFGRIGWEAMNIFDDGHGAIQRMNLDLRGYLGLIGKSVLSMRAYYHSTDGPIPDYQRPYVGGSASLRGHPASAFLDDNVAYGSIELRIPLTTIYEVSQAGFSVFLDAATTYPHGVSLNRARVHKGVGVGGFIVATFLRLNVDVAHDLEDGVRVHFTFGSQF